MRDQATQAKLMYLHDVDLGPPLPADVRQRLLQELRGHDALKAILQTLRDLAAEERRASTESSRNRHYLEKMADGQVIQMSMNDPVFHTGLAQGYEDAFWELFRMMAAEENKADSGQVGS